MINPIIPGGAVATFPASHHSAFFRLLGIPGDSGGPGFGRICVTGGVVLSGTAPTDAVLAFTSYTIFVITVDPLFTKNDRYFLSLCHNFKQLSCDTLTKNCFVVRIL